MRGRPKIRQRILIAVVMLAIMVGVPVVWYQLSVQPGAALVRVLFESAPAVHPGPGISLSPEGVTTVPGILIPADGVPDARLELHLPTAGEGPLPVILWIHGGGFVANSASDIAGYAALLADAGYLVAALDYTLAPAARYPTPVLQGDAALLWIVENIARFGGDPSRIVIGGDSAGAQLASQLAAMQTTEGFAETVGTAKALAPGQLRGVILFCGLYSMDTVAGTGFPALRTFLWAYTGQRDWLDFPRIDELSTVQNLSPGYPPVFIAVGDADPFRSQSEEFVAALLGQGVEVHTEFWDDEGLGHEYQFDFRLPQARQTLAGTLGFLERATR